MWASMNESGSTANRHFTPGSFARADDRLIIGGVKVVVGGRADEHEDTRVGCR